MLERLRKQTAEIPYSENIKRLKEELEQSRGRSYRGRSRTLCFCGFHLCRRTVSEKFF